MNNGRNRRQTEQVRGGSPRFPGFEISAYKSRPTPHSPTSCSPPRAAATTKPVSGFVQSFARFADPDLLRGAAFPPRWRSR